MEAVQLGVAIAHEQRGRQRFNPATQQPEHIERRVVRPVHVLEHQDRRRARPQLPHERCRHIECARVSLHELLELAARVLGDVEEGPERARGEQGITGPPQQSRALRQAVAEAPQERGLADTGLPADEQQATARAALHGIHALAQRRELVAALE